jgi:hypothetical protein
MYAKATTEILSFGKDEFGQLQKYMDIYSEMYAKDTENLIF